VTGAIKRGDIVEIDKKGRRFFATVSLVSAPAGGVRHLAITPITRETYRTCTTREVIGIYRKAKGSA
jgi:hypothetical protein